MDHSQEKKVIRQGSKSFFLASLFFSKQVREDSWRLYHWCRVCDDRIDSAPKELSEKEIQSLYLETQSAMTTSASSDCFTGLNDLITRYHIPRKYIFDMLEGFKADVYRPVLQTEKELLTYSYQVAGVVGLVMSYIMGVNHPKALEHAVDLGIAMQLTNIARDIQEDFLRQRIYLPQTWLTEENLPSEDLLNPDHRFRLFKLVCRLLDLADTKYSAGRQGLHNLPLRAAWAVCIASYIYQAIGKKLRRRKEQALEYRTVVSLPEKIYWVAFGSFRLAPIVMSRLIQPWRRVSLRHVEYTYE